jgi:hypothetical protein
MEIILVEGLYQDIKQLIKRLEYLISNCKILNIDNLGFLSYDESTGDVKINHNEFLYLKPYSSFTNDKENKNVMKMPPYGVVVIHRHKDIDYSIENLITKVVLKNKLSMQLGFPADCNLLLKGRSQFPANINFGLPSQFFIYCDIIEYQQVGHTYSKVLKIVTIDNDLQYGCSVSKNCFPIQYVNISERSFDTIQIDIRDSQGCLIPFLNGTLIVTLHFVKKPPNI